MSQREEKKEKAAVNTKHITIVGGKAGGSQYVIVEDNYTYSVNESSDSCIDFSFVCYYALDRRWTLSMILLF